MAKSVVTARNAKARANMLRKWPEKNEARPKIWLLRTRMHPNMLRVHRAGRALQPAAAYRAWHSCQRMTQVISVMRDASRDKW